MMLGFDLREPGFIPIEFNGRLCDSFGMPQRDLEGEMGFRGGDRGGCRQDDPIIEAFQVERGIPPSPPIASQCGHHG
jgi:hypothetical protein